MVGVEDGLKNKKPSQKARMGSPGSCTLKPGKGSYRCAVPGKDLHPPDPPCCTDRDVFPSVRQQGMHSGTSTAPTEGKAPLAAVQHVKHEQGHSPGTYQGDSQLYSSIVNLAEAAASLLLCGLYAVSQSCLLFVTENMTEDRKTRLHWLASSCNLILLSMACYTLIIVWKTC